MSPRRRYPRAGTGQTSPLGIFPPETAMLVSAMNSLRASAQHLERRHWFLLSVLGAAAFFEGYDLNIVAVALPQLRHTFRLTQADASLWISLVFLGALPAVLLT